jgi:hypothetical protein
MDFATEFVSTIVHRDGDATEPVASGRKIIAHITNNLGGWGSGFVVPLGSKYPQSKAMYQRWATSGRHVSDNWLTDFPPFTLGQTQFVVCTPSIVVANMTAQDGYPSKDNPHPCNLGATTQCLATVFEYARLHRASVHMPEIGCGLGGATWDEIENCIQAAANMASSYPSLTVYHFA